MIPALIPRRTLVAVPLSISRELIWLAGRRRQRRRSIGACQRAAKPRSYIRAGLFIRLFYGHNGTAVLIHSRRCG